MIKIDKGIDIPKKSHGLTQDLVKVLKDMDVGDSFFLEEYTATQMHGYLRAARQNRDMRFSCRKVHENSNWGCRVWRIK